jgi:hypothetical protein
MKLQQEPVPSLEARLEPLVEARQTLLAERARIERELQTVNDQISNALLEEGCETADVGNYRVSFSLRTRTTLDKLALLEAGVPTSTIKACEKTTTYTVLDVRAKKP